LPVNYAQFGFLFIMFHKMERQRCQEKVLEGVVMAGALITFTGIRRKREEKLGKYPSPGDLTRSGNGGRCPPCGWRVRRNENQ
jgi:hypothetical protein